MPAMVGLAVASSQMPELALLAILPKSTIDLRTHSSRSRITGGSNDGAKIASLERASYCSFSFRSAWVAGPRVDAERRNSRRVAGRQSDRRRTLAVLDSDRPERFDHRACGTDRQPARRSPSMARAARWTSARFRPPNIPNVVCETTVPAGLQRGLDRWQSRCRCPSPIRNASPSLAIPVAGSRPLTTSRRATIRSQWPFASVAASAADWDPDLIIHVGDYLYRESPCPADNAGCAGSPYGDTWATWNADFFEPAAPLLDAAPWILVRGNHEDCSREGTGWFRYLDPMPMPRSCEPYTEPYALTIGRCAGRRPRCRLRAGHESHRRRDRGLQTDLRSRARSGRRRSNLAPDPPADVVDRRGQLGRTGGMVDGHLRPGRVLTTIRQPSTWSSPVTCTCRSSSGLPRSRNALPSSSRAMAAPSSTIWPPASSMERPWEIPTSFRDGAGRTSAS